MRTLSLLSLLLIAAGAWAQTDPGTGTQVQPMVTPAARKLTPEEVKQLEAQNKADRAKLNRIRQVGTQGIYVRIKDIARFRGIRPNQLLGYGLIVGLEGSGDTRATPFTQQLLANAMKTFGAQVDANSLRAKNIAVVAITAELPPFASPGNLIDVTVQSIGDAKSLQGGFLLQSPLYSAASREVVYAVAQGAISIGGFGAASGGSAVQKNALNVGRIPDGAIVETGAPTKFVFENLMFLELDDQDLTTANRIAKALNQVNPKFAANPLNGGTIQLAVPEGLSAIAAMSQIEMTSVFADIPATVVINERTGTIVAGGNIKLGPALVAKGSLNVRIDETLVISQPGPLSNGQTAVEKQPSVSAGEDDVQVTLFDETATVADLARLFQTLKVTPTDMISIFQALRDQGALKARIRIQ